MKSDKQALFDGYFDIDTDCGECGGTLVGNDSYTWCQNPKCDWKISGPLTKWQAKCWRVIEKRGVANGMGA